MERETGLARTGQPWGWSQDGGGEPRVGQAWREAVKTVKERASWGMAVAVRGGGG